MTDRARDVLADCRLTLSMLEEEADLDRWRVLWAASAALARAVGHVLDKVDSKNDPAVRKASAAAYNDWKSSNPEHEIFREFIELERNNILKQYEFQFHPMEAVPVAVQTELGDANTGERTLSLFSIDLDQNCYRPHLGRYREGDDCRDILSDALDWWEQQLILVDQAAALLRAK